MEKYIVIAEFHDREADVVREVGDVIELPDDRADALLEAQVIDYTDEESGEGEDGDQTAPEAAEDVNLEDGSPSEGESDGDGTDDDAADEGSATTDEESGEGEDGDQTAPEAAEDVNLEDLSYPELMDHAKRLEIQFKPNIGAVKLRELVEAKRAQGSVEGGE